MRDSKTEEAKRHINQGVKIKMDEQGNILIKRLCKNNVYVKSTNQEDNAIGPEIIRNSQGALEHEKPGKVRLMNFIVFEPSVCVGSPSWNIYRRKHQNGSITWSGVLISYLLFSIKKKKKNNKHRVFLTHIFVLVLSWYLWEYTLIEKLLPF